jgi:hypothetical protein
VGGGQKIALRAGFCLPIPVCKKSRGCCPTASNPYWYNDKKSPFVKKSWACRKWVSSEKFLTKLAAGKWFQPKCLFSNAQD